MEIDDVTGVIVDAAVKIHRDLGSCLFESVYELALSTALQRRVCVSFGNNHWIRLRRH